MGHLPAVRGIWIVHAYGIFRDKLPRAFASLADGENSVLLIETTQLLRPRVRSVDTIVVYSAGGRIRNNFDRRGPRADRGPKEERRERSKLQGTQLSMLRTYLNVILIHEYADRDYLRY